MASKKFGIVHYMQNREHGINKRIIKKSEDTALSIGEEKATLPVKNQPCELSGQSRSTFLMAFSPDGNKIASTHGDHTVRVTDIRPGRCTHILTGHPRTPWCIAFHPTSNDILASGCLGGEVRIWDLHGGGSEVWKSGSGYVISSLAFHPVDQVLVFAQGNEIHFWDWKESKPFAHCKTANDYEKVRWVKFDVWGHHLFTGIANGSTVQRNDSLDEYSYISVPHVNTYERRRLRNEYNMLVNRMTANQRLRIHTAYPPGISNTQSEVELIEPRSPTHNSFNTQGLNDAARYAAQVTSNRGRALRNAREYAAHVTSQAFQDAARRIQEGASSTAQSSERYRDGQRSETDSDIPAASSPRPRQTGLFNLASREPCQPTTSSATLDTNSWQSVVSSSSDSIVRNVLLPDFSGPTAVSSTNIPRRSSILARPPQSGASLLRSRLCASAASSSESTAPQTSGPGALLGSASEAAAMSASGATATSLVEPTVTSILPTNGVSATAGNSSVGNPIPTCRSAPASVSGRPSLLRSFLSVPPMTSTTASSVMSSSDRAPTTVSAGTTNPPLVIYGGDEGRDVTPAAAGSSTTGLFSFSRNFTTNDQTVTGSGESDTRNFEPRNDSADSGVTRNDQADEESSGSPEPGSSCPENCNICSGMPGVRETLAQHRMRMRRRRLAMRSSGLGRRGVRRSPSHPPPSEALSSERPPRERTQTLASYIDSEVRRVLGQQDGQESDSSDSTAERSDTYEQPTALIIPPSMTSSSSSENQSDSSVNSLTERRRQLYERLRNDVREMENDVRDLRNVMRQRQMEMRVQSLMRYRQRREDRQRRIDERLHLSGVLGVAGRGRTGPRSSRFQNPNVRTAERLRRNRLHIEELRAGYRDAIRDVHRQIPQITVTQASPESEDTPSSLSRSATGEALSQIRRLREDMLEERHAGQLRTEDRAWHSISRRSLHQHYSTSILDETISRPDDGLHAAINRAIAGAFMGTGEAAVASNIVSLTHRIQRWDFTNAKVPDITDNATNVIVAECKLHNDASVDIAQDGSMLAVLVPSPRGFPNDTIMGVFSLTGDTLGQCLYTKSFGPNAISVSISPLNNYVLVGLAAKRLQWVFTPKQMVAQVFKMKTKEAGEDSMEHICDLMHPCDLDIRTHVSVNSARWLPGVGEGIIYGTNRGDLHICRPGDDEKDRKDRTQPSDTNESNSIRRNLMQMLGIAVPDTTSTATQTVHRIRRTASTQTDGAANNPNAMPTNSSTADQRNVNMSGRSSNSWYLPNAPR